MSGGGKGGSTTSQVQVPQWLNDAAQGNVAKAEEMAKIGNVDYRGPDVAAFTPMQMASFQNTQDAANAFGVAVPAGGPMAGMPTAQTFAGGVQGYSAAPIYDQAKAEMQRLNPAQYEAIMAPFINGQTGAMPGGAYAGGSAGGAVGGKTRVPVSGASREAPQGSAASRNTKFDTPSKAKASGPATRQQSGYSGVRDMLNGGGPRASRNGPTSGRKR
jgi:hypothetical protein